MLDLGPSVDPSDLVGAVGRQRVKPLPRRPRRRGHRQAEQEAAPRHPGHPEHAHRWRRAHAGHEAVGKHLKTSGTSSSQDSLFWVLSLVKLTS